MKLKTAVVNTKDWNLAECMSVSRFVEYDPEQFKEATDVHALSNKFCSSLEYCKVKKCSLKKAIKKHKSLILHAAEQQKEQELKQQIKTFKHHLENIAR